MVEYYPRGNKELLGPFHSFMTGDTMAWFDSQGMALKIEEDGQGVSRIRSVHKPSLIVF